MKVPPVLRTYSVEISALVLAMVATVVVVSHSIYATSAQPTVANCVYRGALPDPDCTPGVVNLNVTQDNIAETVCKSGWTATIRPSESYTNQLKRQQMLAYHATGDPSAYEEDHLISLELGGHPTDPKNLWPEAGGSPNAKARVENLLHERVCRGEMSLADAQKAISSD